MYRSAAAPSQCPSPVYLRAAIGGVESSAGLSITPDISPKKLQGVLTFAQPAYGETPLLLVDSSVLASGKAGMLVTDRAVYFDNPRARVPLEAIVYAPTSPSVRSGPSGGTLTTTMGVVTLPGMVESSAVAMRRALRAIAFYNRGASRFDFGHTPVIGPVGEAAAHVLRHERLHVAPCIPARALHAASNLAYAWPDHDAGEELVAFLDETVAEDGSRFIALTDRRIIAHGDNPVDVPYASLTEASLKTGMLTNDLVLGTASRRVTVNTIAPAAVAQLVASFLSHVGALPPAHRQAWPGPPADADDPSGAVAALRSLPWPDLRVAALLELVHAAVARDVMPVDIARDLVVRAMRLQRTLRGGHGRSGDVQRSPLGAADLEHALSQVVGAPVQQGMHNGARTLVYMLGGGSSSAAGTLASNVVGLTLLAVVGVGWMTTGSGSSTTSATLRVWEAPGGAGFALLSDQGRPLADAAPKLAGGVLEALAELSAPLLLRRALYGWNLPSHALVMEPDAAIEARARALVPHIDLGPFLSQ